MSHTHLNIETHPRHIPVLLQETYRYLVSDNRNKGKDSFVHLDCNFGDAGHVEFFIAQAITQDVHIDTHAIDADQYAIERGLHFLKKKPETTTAKVQIYKGNFKDLNTVVPQGIYFDSMLFDLGLSTYQLSSSGRGFSFKFDESLDMRFKTDDLDADGGEFTAYDIVNYWEPDTIALILRSYAQEARAWKIAQAIVAARAVLPITSSKQLVDIIIRAIGPHKGKIHPATKTFQALRIAVNNEIEVLRNVLDQVIERLTSGGRVGVISYHSLEDSVVKQKFKEWEQSGLGRRVEKKVVVPTEKEEKINPRSRSAKFRIFEKK